MWKMSTAISQRVGGSLSNPASSNASGVFAGPISSGAAVTGCSGGMTNFYAGNSTIPSSFGPVFTNLVSSSNTANGQTLALVTTTDSIMICGTESRAVSIAQIFPGQSMTGATAAGASTLALLKWRRLLLARRAAASVEFAVCSLAVLLTMFVILDLGDLALVLSAMTYSTQVAVREAAHCRRAPISMGLARARAAPARRR